MVEKVMTLLKSDEMVARITNSLTTIVPFKCSITDDKKTNVAYRFSLRIFKLSKLGLFSYHTEFNLRLRDILFRLGNTFFFLIFLNHLSK